MKWLMVVTAVSRCSKYLKPASVCKTSAKFQHCKFIQQEKT
jgi:hypothetical protein